MLQHGGHIIWPAFRLPYVKICEVCSHLRPAPFECSEPSCEAATAAGAAATAGTLAAALPAAWPGAAFGS
eukprot:2587617-Pleurochrysis_carterae.AAC.1